MKQTFEEINNLRKKRQTRFLITGATGFLGSHTAVAMLEQGYKVILFARPNRNGSAGDRVNAMLKWFNINDNCYPDQIKIIEGNLDSHDLGIDKKTIEFLSSNVDEIIHCAAATSFSEKKREELNRTNVDIPGNILKVFGSSESRCSMFHHISTVYVAGKTGTVFKESPAWANNFFNPYEESKFEGEQFISSRFPEKGINVNIYRPSIVYGNSETGRSSLFNAVYYPVKMALFLRDTYLKDIRKKGGIRAKEMGVRELKDNSIYLPIRIEKREGGKINLIPVNFYTDAFIALMENTSKPGIFHIINNSPPALEDITDYFTQSFNITGFQAVSRQEMAETPKNALEILFNDYLEMYGPYMRDVREFDNRISDEILKNSNIRCPEFDLNVFSKCMNYAIISNWKNPWEKP